MAPSKILMEKVIKVIFGGSLGPYLCTVKNATLIIISLVMLTKPMWPLVDYVVNYEYIVNVLCENKDKPEMHCNGTCHLTKELAKEAGTAQDNPFNSKTSKSEIPQVIISEIITEFTFAMADEPVSVKTVAYRSNLNPSLFTSKILHPPRLG